MSLDPMDAFRAACGAIGPLILEEGGGGHAEGLTIRQPFALVGRRPGADLVVDHPEVGRRHAYLQRVDGRLFCVDLESRTGTRLAGGGPTGWVPPPTTIGVGPYKIRCPGGGGDDGDSPAEALDEPSPLSGDYARGRSLPDAYLEIRGDGAGTASWPMGPALVLVGRSRLCKVKPQGPDASRFSCSLLRTGGGVWLVDLLAARRVLVNGEERRCVLLEDGDELQIGRCTLRLRYGRPTTSLAPRVGLATSGEMDVAGPSRDHAAIPSRRRGRRTPLEGSPAPPPVALPEAAILSILDQVGQMQQQMCDQFQQTMTMMAQLFGASHRDHMAASRELTEQIRQLAEASRARADGRATPLPEPAAPAAGAAPARSEGPSPAFNGAPAGRLLDPTGGAPTSEGMVALPADATGPEPEELPRLEPKEVIRLAAARLEAYERERQGRWRKILRILGR